MTRVSGVALVALLVLVARVRGQGTGAVEAGVFGQYVNFDNSLGLENTLGVGAGIGVYLEPALTLQLDGMRSSPAGSSYTPLRFRAVYHGAADARVSPVLGGGYVRNWYGGPTPASDGGLSLLLGLRYRAGQRVWLQLGADLDMMFHTADDTRFLFYNGNWGIHLGPAIRLR